MVSVATLPPAVIYLLLVLVGPAGGFSSVQADYLQDGAPAFSVRIAAPDDAPSGLIRIVAESVDDGVATVYDAEPSRIASHHYLVHVPDSPVPVVFNLAPVLAQASRRVEPGDWVIELSGEDESSSAGVEPGLAGPVHVLTRDGATLLSVPGSGIVLLVTGD